MFKYKASCFRGSDDYMDVVGRTNHDYRDIGGRVMPGAITEETESSLQISK